MALNIDFTKKLYRLKFLFLQGDEEVEETRYITTDSEESLYRYLNDVDCDKCRLFHLELVRTNHFTVLNEKSAEEANASL